MAAAVLAMFPLDLVGNLSVEAWLVVAVFAILVGHDLWHAFWGSASLAATEPEKRKED